MTKCYSMSNLIQAMKRRVRGKKEMCIRDSLCSFLRAQAANICDTLFRDEYMGIVFGVVNMGAHRNLSLIHI